MTIMYAKILDEDKKLCAVGEGTNTAFYKKIGMELMDVEQSDITGEWYLKGYAPKKTVEEKAKEERDRLNMLSLTKREVFLALYKDKGLTPEQLRAQITDPEALIEFDFANEYFRGNENFCKIAEMLGYTNDKLDYLFQYKKFPKKEPKEKNDEEQTDEPEPTLENGDEDENSLSENVSPDVDNEELE